MGFSSDHRLFSRERSVHQILGGGTAADLILWRQKNLTVGVAMVVGSVWLVFERSGYTLLSLTSSVFLLLFSILFIWAKAAALLNRPAPPLPDLRLTEELVTEVAAIIRERVNTLLSVSQSIALGEDSRLFFKVAGWLLFASVVGGWTDFVTLSYACFMALLTVPFIYERYEDQVDRTLIFVYRRLWRLYVKLDEQIAAIREWDWDMEKIKVD